MYNRKGNNRDPWSYEIDKLIEKLEPSTGIHDINTRYTLQILREPSKSVRTYQLRALCDLITKNGQYCDKIDCLSLWSWRFLGTNKNLCSLLSNALLHNTSIDKLHLINCQLDSNEKLYNLIECLTKRGKTVLSPTIRMDKREPVLLKDIRFTGNQFGGDMRAINTLGYFLSNSQTCHSLETIELSRIKLKDEAFILLIDFLIQSNYLLFYLKKFKLSQNKLTHESMKSVTKWLLTDYKYDQSIHDNKNINIDTQVPIQESKESIKENKENKENKDDNENTENKENRSQATEIIIVADNISGAQAQAQTHSAEKNAKKNPKKWTFSFGSNRNKKADGDNGELDSINAKNHSTIRKSVELKHAYFLTPKWEIYRKSNFTKRPPISISLRNNYVKDIGVVDLLPIFEYDKLSIDEFDLRSCGITIHGVRLILNSHISKQNKILRKHGKFLFNRINNIYNRRYSKKHKKNKNANEHKDNDNDNNNNDNNDNDDVGEEKEKQIITLNRDTTVSTIGSINIVSESKEVEPNETAIEADAETEAETKTQILAENEEMKNMEKFENIEKSDGNKFYVPLDVCQLIIEYVFNWTLDRSLCMKLNLTWVCWDHDNLSQYNLIGQIIDEYIICIDDYRLISDGTGDSSNCSSSSSINSNKKGNKNWNSICMRILDFRVKDPNENITNLMCFFKLAMFLKYSQNSIGNLGVFCFRVGKSHYTKVKKILDSILFGININQNNQNIDNINNREILDADDDDGEQVIFKQLNKDDDNSINNNRQNNDDNLDVVNCNENIDGDVNHEFDLIEFQTDLVLGKIDDNKNDADDNNGDGGSNNEAKTEDNYVDDESFSKSNNQSVDEKEKIEREKTRKEVELVRNYYLSKKHGINDCWVVQSFEAQGDFVIMHKCYIDYYGPKMPIVL